VRDKKVTQNMTQKSKAFGRVLLHRCSYLELLQNPTCRAKLGKKENARVYFLAQD